MKAIPVVALPALCVGLAAPAAVNAQSVLPLSVEGHVGVGVPTGDFSEFADPSYGLGATVTYDLAPMVGIRAGYSYQRFGVSEEDIGDVDADLSDSGFALGLELSPMLAPGLNLLLHADAILHQIEAPTADEGVASGSVTSDRSFGFDVGAGVAFPVTPRLSIVPRVRYRQYDAEFDFDGEDEEATVSYFAAGAGLKIRF